MYGRLSAVTLFLIFSSFFFSSTAYAVDYYYKDSYGRGVGTAVTANCGGGQLDAGLCYPHCSSGYTGVGPICWKDILTSYSRGVGKVPAYNCGSREADAGLCYEPCRAGYKGAGPVCWQLPPQGFVDCGAGFAASTEVCALVTTGQAVAAAMAVGKVVSGGFADGNKLKWAQLDPAQQAQVGVIMTRLAPLLNKMGPIFNNAVAKGGNVAKRLKELAPEIPGWMKSTADIAPDIAFIGKQLKVGASVAYQMQQGPEQWIEWLRLVTTITSLVDQTPVSGVISSYAYPVHPPYNYAPPKSPPGLMVDTTNLYTVTPMGDLMWYQHNTEGKFTIGGKQIGAGWAGFTFLQAVRLPGAGGAFYAIAPNGDLLYYQHDSNGIFTTAGKKIGNGWGGIRSFMAARKGLLYVVRDNGDLVEYKHNDAFAFAAPRVIGTGWAVKRLFSGGEGAFFVIDDDGRLRYYYHNGTSFTVTNLTIGSGWNLPYVVGAGNGTLYAVAETDELIFYRLVNNQFINSGVGVQIGVGWGAPGKYGLIAGQY